MWPIDAVAVGMARIVYMGMKYLALAMVLVGGCAGRGLEAGSDGQHVAVSFDACQSCHARPAPMAAVFDASHPNDFRDEVRKMLSEDHHPYRLSTEQWNALMLWTDQT
jgi:hypothetical protein